MSNIMVASIYLPFAIVIVVILLEVLLSNTRHKSNYLFMVLCLLVICWYATDIAGALTSSVRAAKFFWHLILIFVAFIPPVLLLFVLDFYQVQLKRMSKLIPFLFVVPTIITVMVLSSEHHALLYAQLDIISLSPIHTVVRVWGPWFWVHTVHCYVISMAIISIILIQHFHLPKFYRLPSNLMTVGIAITLLGNVVTLLKFLPAALDPTLIGTSLALIFFNFAIINNDRSKFIRYSQGKVFNYLDLYILVMDENDRVVHANHPTHDWLSSLGIAVDSAHLSDIMKSLMRKGAIQKETENDKGVDIYFPSDPFPTVLNMYVQKMTDTNGDNIGSVAIFTDVTQNRLLLKRLEEKAGMDSLTGVANRMAYEGAKKRLNTTAYLPLSVIMCDVNGLKTVNDSFGHQYGDLMLQAISEILEAACPAQSFLARIGGDEFVYLLSNTSEESASTFIEGLRERLSSRKDLPFPLMVAFGAATKYTADEQLSDMINLADSRMYENKRMIKAQH